MSGFIDDKNLYSSSLSKFEGVLIFKENLLAKISIFDPHLEKESFPGKCEVVEDPYNVENDIIVIATAHKEILELDWKKMTEKCSSRVIYDGRRCLNKEEMAEVGWSYLGIGM